MGAAAGWAGRLPYGQTDVYCELYQCSNMYKDGSTLRLELDGDSRTVRDKVKCHYQERLFEGRIFGEGGSRAWDGVICEIIPGITHGQVFYMPFLMGIIFRNYIQSDLVYPNSLVPIEMCSDCETCGLLNHCE